MGKGGERVHPFLELTLWEGVKCVRVTPPQPLGNRSVYVFVVDGMLIDTGCATAEPYLAELYASWSGEIEQVVLTHSHEDHTGTAAWITGHTPWPVYIHPNGVAFCAAWPDYGAYRRNTWGLRKPFAARALGERFCSRTLEWKALYTPGHADDHVALLDEEHGWLFCGDLFLAPKTKVIMRHESVPTLMRSLRHVLAQDFQTVFCSHGGMLSDGRRLLTKKLDDLERLCGEILHRHRQGWSVEAINEHLFPEKWPIIQISGGEFDSIHIVRSVIRELAEEIPSANP